MGGDGLPGPDRRLDHAGRPGPRDLADPARHAGHGRHLPAARGARDQRRAGRPDVRRPGRARARDRLVRRRSTPPTASRSRRWGSGSTGSRSSSRSCAGSGPRRAATPSAASTTSWSTHPALPKPAQAHVPIIVGGFGAKRTPRIAATWADEYNVPFHNVAETGRRLRAGARGLLRRPAGRWCCRRPRWSASVPERSSSAGRRSIGRDVEGLRRDGLAGSPAEVVDKLGLFAEAGATRVYLQVMDLADLDHLELIASEVMPQLEAVLKALAEEARGRVARRARRGAASGRCASCRAARPR